MIDPFDDLGNARAPFKVVACMAVHGRGPLLEQTIKRLYRKNDCYKVICSGSSLQDKQIVESFGGVFIAHENNPLGKKWNAAFQAAREFDPDAVLFVGSSDFIEDRWIHIVRGHVENFGFAGAMGCYFVDLGTTKRLVWWPGYAKSRNTRDRDDETIGIGRMLSRDLMNKLDWSPFDPQLNASLDASMKRRAAAVGFKDVMVPGVKALSISTDKWTNKHNFDQHWNNLIPSQRIGDVDTFLKQFPEINIVDEALHHEKVNNTQLTKVR